MHDRADTELGTRAVAIKTTPGVYEWCAGCASQIRFQPWRGTRPHHICANVYRRGTWDRVEHWHPTCYRQAGHPHGPILERSAQ